MPWHCYSPQLHHSISSHPTRLATCITLTASSTLLIMGFSEDELRTAGDWSPPERNCSFVCPDRRDWLSTVPAGSITGSFFTSSLEGGGRSAVAFDVENGTWLQDLATPIPWFSSSNTAQLVESDGKLFVFSEQQRDQWVDRHCIDELEFLNPQAGVLTCRCQSFVKIKKSGGRGLQVYPEQTCVGFGEVKLGIFNPLSKKQLNILLASCIAIMPNRACAEDQSMDSLSSNLIPSISWESLDIAKAVAGTLLAGLMMIGAARFAWGIFRRRQAPGNRFDIMQGLEDSDIPTRGNPSFAILPDIL